MSEKETPVVDFIKINNKEFNVFAKWSVNNYAENLIKSGDEKFKLKAIKTAKNEFKSVFPDGVDYSYASIDGLKEFANIDICDIEIRNVSGIKFILLSLEQYLKVYQKSSQDGYRMNVKEKLHTKEYIRCGAEKIHIVWFGKMVAKLSHLLWDISSSMTIALHTIW